MDKLVIYIFNRDILPFIKATEFIRHRKDVTIKAAGEDETGVKYEINCTHYIAFRLGAKFNNEVLKREGKIK